MRAKGWKLPVSLREEASSIMDVCIRQNPSCELLMTGERKK